MPGKKAKDALTSKASLINKEPETTTLSKPVACIVGASG